MNQGDLKKIGITVVGAVAAAYTLKYLRKKGWL